MKSLLRSQPYTWQTPNTIVEKLVESWGSSGLIWLDGDGSKLGRWATLAVNPIDQICCRGLPEEKNATNPFSALRELSPGHWTGWLSYEAGAWVEPRNPWKKRRNSNTLACIARPNYQIRPYRAKTLGRRNQRNSFYQAHQMVGWFI